MNMKTNKQQGKKAQSGTMTANYDLNSSYSSSNMGSANTAGSAASSSTANSTASTANSSTAAKNKASKAEYGTMTAKLDANNDYSE